MGRLLFVGCSEFLKTLRCIYRALVNEPHSSATNFKQSHPECTHSVKRTQSIIQK